jgi:hypothetical protein
MEPDDKISKPIVEKTKSRLDEPEIKTPKGPIKRGAETKKRRFYRIDDTAKRGDKIEDIFAQTDTYVVYINTKDEVHWEYDEDLPKHMVPAVTEYNRLKSKGKIILHKSQRAYLAILLGRAMSSAFLLTDQEGMLELFEPANKFLGQRGESRSRITYLVSASVFTVVFLAVLVLAFVLNKGPYISLQNIILGSLGGVFGAALSVYRRGRKLEIDYYTPQYHIFIQGGIRVILGMLFGGFIIVAMSAKIALGEIPLTNYTIFAFGVVAGFSERFVPDIIERASSKQSEKPDTNDAPPVIEPEKDPVK